MNDLLLVNLISLLKKSRFVTFELKKDYEKFYDDFKEWSE